jgi:hypothetical protein
MGLGAPEKDWPQTSTEADTKRINVLGRKIDDVSSPIVS